MTMQLGHIHLKVRDLERAIAFYVRVFGLEVTETVAGQYAFLTGNGMHHTVALQNVGPGAPAPPPHGTGLYHVAFEVPNRAAFAAAYQALTAEGVPVFPVDHRISWAMYFSDPDGNGLEIYADTRRPNEDWRGINLPLTAEAIRRASGDTDGS